MKIITVLSVCFIIILSSCRKHDDKIIQSIWPACYQNADLKIFDSLAVNDLDSAYQTVIAINPEIIKDTSRLSCEVYQWLKSHPKKRGRGDNDYVAKWLNLTNSEVELIFHNYNVVNIPALKLAKNAAFQLSESSYPCDLNSTSAKFNDNKADALRHSYFIALLSKYCSPNFAIRLGAAHEEINIPDQLGMNRKIMDLHNNRVGAFAFMNNPKASDQELLNILRTKEFIYLPDIGNASLTSLENSLVYFAGQQPYDIRMHGTLTNPDANTNWDVEFYFNQCDNIIRGQYKITSGTNFQFRRFNGTISGSDISLNVDNPYAWEGGNYCVGVKVELVGSTNSLSGNWTSTSCSKGGLINLTK